MLRYRLTFKNCLYAKCASHFWRVLLKIALFAIFLFLPSPVHAGKVIDVTCPTPSTPVAVNFSYTSTVNIIVASNEQSYWLPETPSGVYSQFSIDGTSNSSGIIRLTYSAGTITNAVCVASSDDDLEIVSFNLLMGLAGVLCAGLVWYGVNQAFVG